MALTARIIYKPTKGKAKHLDIPVKDGKGTFLLHRLLAATVALKEAVVDGEVSIDLEVGQKTYDIRS